MPTIPPQPPDDSGEAARHHPLLYSTSRNGCWGECACGWVSETFTTLSGVHLDFGQHLLLHRVLSAPSVVERGE